MGDAAGGPNAVHDASGAGVSPVRALKSAAVPAGNWPDAVRVIQSAGSPASNTREVKTPDAAYGVSVIQSSDSAPPATLKSLPIGRRLAAIATACVATTEPSIENVVPAVVQSTRKRCGDPIHCAPSGVSMLAAPLCVRAKSAPPF